MRAADAAGREVRRVEIIYPDGSKIVLVLPGDPEAAEGELDPSSSTAEIVL
jgi:hypothetical protein